MTSNSNFQLNFQSLATGQCEIAVEDIAKVVLPLTMQDQMLMSSPAFHQQIRNFSSNAKKSRGITSIEYKKSPTEHVVKYFVNRDVTCGELRKEDVGRTVSLVGWLDSKKHGKFLQLKDGYGITQVIVDPEETAIRQEVSSVRDDSIVLVRGRVVERPPSMIRNNSETGEIEVIVNEFKIIDPEAEYVNPSGESNDTNMLIDIESSSSNSPSSQLHSPINKSLDNSKTNLYTYRTHTCGELNESNIGQEVTLTGWLEFHRMKKFFTLRDGYGCTQVIVPDELLSTYNLDSIPYESILKVSGLVLGEFCCLLNY